MGNAELKLVDHQGLIDIFLQQLDQHRGLVADAEASDLSAAVEKLKGLGHLFRLHQRIGPVQKQRVQIIGVQPFQNAVNAFQNMALGNQYMYVDRFAAKNTINFFGLVSLCVGALNPEEGDLVVLRESHENYERAIIRNHRLVGFLAQGDISHAGIYQYLIKNEVDIQEFEAQIFDVNFGNFFGIKENGEYIWSV